MKQEARYMPDETTEFTRRERLNLWWLNNRRELAYYTVGCIAGVAATVIVYKNGEKGADVPSITMGDGGTVNNVAGDYIEHQSNVERLSYIVTDGEKWWKSQAEAAEALGVDPVKVSRHINHGKDLPNGKSLERVGVHS